MNELDTVELSIEYPQQLSRLHLLLKTLFGFWYIGLPHGIILFGYGILNFFVTLAAFVAILIVGRYPEGLFNIAVGYHRWSLRASAYLFYMTDSLPPFSSSSGSHGVNLEVAYPGHHSRMQALSKFFLGWLYIGIPHGFMLALYGFVVYFVLVISWFSILIFGRFPEGFFRFTTGYYRWSNRVALYKGFLTNQYPSFSGRP